MKILPVGAEIFDADRRRVRYDEAKTIFIRTLMMKLIQDRNT
jgi:hypothetical protein